MNATAFESLRGTVGWEPLRFHPDQCNAWRSTKRFINIAAGRGSGKTELARRKVIRWLPINKAWPDPLYFYALPTRDQAKRIAWPKLKALTPPAWIDKIWESDLIIRTKFGSTLYVLGMDKPQRIEGVQWDGGVVDEACDQKPGVFALNIMPALTHKFAWCWRIGVPKRYGAGAPEFKAAFDLGMAGTAADTESYTWKSDTVLTPEQLEFAKNTYSEADYAEQYEASWEKASGLIFSEFSEANIDNEVNYDPTKAILVGCDFNVDPMCWTFSHRYQNKAEKTDYLCTFAEMKLKGVTTQMGLDWVYEKWGRTHEAGWIFVGDATGRARKTAAAFSDYVQIQNDRRFKRSQPYFPDSNPSRLDRYAACNAMLRNALGVRRWRINPACKRLVLDLRNRAYIAGTREPNDKDVDNNEMGHMSDAVGYAIHCIWPLTPQAHGLQQISLGTRT